MSFGTGAGKGSLPRKVNLDTYSTPFLGDYMDTSNHSTFSRTKMSYQSSIASELASALWNCSTLRHGMFTPPQFRKLCEKIILERLLDQNVKTRVVEKGESLESGDLVKEKVIMDLKLPCFFSSNEPKPVVGTTSHCYEGQYFRPIQ